MTAIGAIGFLFISGIILISVGPTVRIISVHRFAAFLRPAGPPTPGYASGPPSGSFRYTASRPSYARPVPPRRLRVGPTVRIISVHRFAAFLRPAGPPTLSVR